MDNHRDTCTIEERRQTKRNQEWTITRTRASLRNEDKQNTTKKTKYDEQHGPHQGMTPCVLQS
jgi:hypothetical protein